MSVLYSHCYNRFHNWFSRQFNQFWTILASMVNGHCPEVPSRTSLLSGYLGLYFGLHPHSHLSCLTLATEVAVLGMGHFQHLVLSFCWMVLLPCHLPMPSITCCDNVPSVQQEDREISKGEYFFISRGAWDWTQDLLHARQMCCYWVTVSSLKKNLLSAIVASNDCSHSCVPSLCGR